MLNDENTTDPATRMFLAIRISDRQLPASNPPRSHKLLLPDYGIPIDYVPS
jgi:hypothetical protein